jgi:hypothetical protein
MRQGHQQEQQPAATENDNEDNCSCSIGFSEWDDTPLGSNATGNELKLKIANLEVRINIVKKSNMHLFIVN